MIFVDARVHLASACDHDRNDPFGNRRTGRVPHGCLGQTKPDPKASSECQDAEQQVRPKVAAVHLARLREPFVPLDVMDEVTAQHRLLAALAARSR